MATAYTRATDGDRNQTCQVLDSALDEGQLSMEEHRQRVSAATKATSLGELESLVSDLQIRNAAIQRPSSTSPSGAWGLRIAIVAVLVALGAGIGWGMSDDTGSASTTTTAPVAKPGNSSPAEVIPTTPPPPPPPQAPPTLLSLGGLSGLLAQMHTKFGDTIGYELTVYPDYAALDRPDSVNAHKPISWYYRGGWLNTGASSIPPNSTVGDLGKFDVQEVLGVLQRAPQTLHVKSANETYLLIESAEDGNLSLQIHLSDGVNSGYVELAADGTVEQLHPSDS